MLQTLPPNYPDNQPECQSTVAQCEGLKTVADCQRKQQHKKILNSEGSQHIIGLHTLSLHLRNQDTFNSNNNNDNIIIIQREKIIDNKTNDDINDMY